MGEKDVLDVDLAMLMSMGVDESRGREALKVTGNADAALLWLSGGDTAAKVQNRGAIEETNSESKGSESTTSSSNISDSNSTSSSSSSRSNNDESTRNMSKEAEEAELLIRELLGNAIGDNLKDLEKEWLGVDMEQESNLIMKYM